MACVDSSRKYGEKALKPERCCSFTISRIYS
jgi:hypothetical protein